MPEDNGKQNAEETYMNKYQKHIACSYGYNLVCAGDKFSNLFRTYLGKTSVGTFFDNMIEKSKYCGEVIKKHFGKKLVMIKQDNEQLHLPNVGYVTRLF